MTGPRLFLVTAAVAALAMACNRADQRLDTEEAREQAREVAAEAGDRLADAWLAAKIQAQFFADDDIRARDISVIADDGIVTLRGRVPDENAHTQAVQTARNTDGVTQLNDELTVGPEAPERTSSGAVATSGALDDARITSTIQSKFFLDDRVKGRRIDVDSRDGVVSLRGEVATESERAQAVSLARATEGVQRVEDALTVNASLVSAPAGGSPSIGEQIDDATITTKIQAKFFLDRDVKAGDMNVTTRDKVVTLEGTAPTQGVKDRALAMARDTEGVSQVIDRIQVER